jgi:hypothetical protein
LDTTKIRVTDGDIPSGDWIFNGQGIVLVPKETDSNGKVEKVVITLDGHMRLTPRKAEEFGPLRQFASDMTPLAGTIAGASLLSGLFGAMTGFAAGKMIARNVATFTCELDDGRKFNAMADYRIFKRLQSLSRN